MHKIMSLLGCLFGFISHAVLYDEYEINFELNQPELAQLSQQFTQNYFTSSTAKTVIDDILKADISPLQREYIFFNLLSEISQHPPQAFHQYFVDLMKRHPIQATNMVKRDHSLSLYSTLTAKHMVLKTSGLPTAQNSILISYSPIT